MKAFTARYRRDLELRPLDRSRNLSAGFYTDPLIAEREEERIFGREWQLVAHAGQLAGPGAYLTSRVGRRPVVVTRDADGRVHVLENVCRHRGGPLVDGHGCAEALVCRYHGWRYGLDGQLLEAPDFGSPQGFDPSRIRLRRLPIHQWCGFILACADSDSTAPVDRWDAIRDRLSEHHPVETYSFGHRQSYDVACNWKVYVDNFLEGYHIPMLHPGLMEQLDFADYRTELTDHYSLQWSALESTVTCDGRGEGDAFYFHVYPNLMLNCLPGRLQTNVVLPLAVDRCRVIFEYFYAEEIPPETRSRDQAACHQTQLEDEAICEIVQQNMASGAYLAGRLSPKWEAAVWGFQNYIRRRLAPD